MLFLLYYIVQCPSLSAPTNGMITCSLGDDGVATDGDTCSFTCFTGYELTGSDIKTCRSDGMWSRSEAVCDMSKYYRNLLLFRKENMLL